jgi:hypothetical protein
MKTKLLALLGVMSLLAMQLPAQTLGQLSDALDSFTSETPKSLPFAAGAGIDWSQAYIGNLLDTNFPFVHLGVGAQVGLTTISSDAVTPFLDLFYLKLPPGLKFLPLPFMVANARLGGLIIPFDVGIKAGFLPRELETALPGYTFSYQNFGIDARFPLVREDFFLPTISVGGGVSVMGAGVEALVGQTVTIAGPSGSVELTDPTLGLRFGAYNVEAKIQISKNILWLFTPYAGASVAYGNGTAEAFLESKSVNLTGQTSDWSSIRVDDRGIHRQGELGSLSLKAYGGMSFDVLILHVDAQAMVDLLSESVGLSVGARVQL